MANPKTKGKPFWFKLYMDDANLIRNSTPKAISDAVKALLCLMEDPAYDAAGLSKTAHMLYSQLRRGVDEATEEYNRASAAGKKGNEVRWGKASPSHRTPISPDPEHEPYRYQKPYPYQDPYPYPEREEEQEQTFPVPYDNPDWPPPLPPALQEYRNKQLEQLRRGEITVNDLLRFGEDVSWPPEEARIYL